MQVMFAGNLDFIRANLHVIPAVVLACLMRVAVASCAMLAMSSLSKSTRYVGHSLHRHHLLHRGDVRRPRVVTGRRAWPGCRSVPTSRTLRTRCSAAAALRRAVTVSVLVLLGLRGRVDFGA
jgi:hypothetical protein